MCLWDALQHLVVIFAHCTHPAAPCAPATKKTGTTKRSIQVVGRCCFGRNELIGTVRSRLPSMHLRIRTIFRSILYSSTFALLLILQSALQHASELISARYSHPSTTLVLILFLLQPTLFSNGNLPQSTRTWSLCCFMVQKKSSLGFRNVTLSRWTQKVSQCLHGPATVTRGLWMR